MQWVVTFWGLGDDVERLASLGLGPTKASVAILDDGALAVSVETTGESPAHDDHAFADRLQSEIEDRVDRACGVLSIIHGFEFRGVRHRRTYSIDAAGERLEFFSIGINPSVMTWELYAKQYRREVGVEPERPEALDAVGALDPSHAQDVGQRHPTVARGLQLLTRAFRDSDEGFDWVAGYAALEVVDDLLRVDHQDGEELGLWNKDERSAFTTTANSPLVLGLRSRHGRLTKADGSPHRPPREWMNDYEGAWFIRGVYARLLGVLELS